VEPHNAPEHRHLLDEMFRLRAHVFHGRLRWDVGVTDDMERDRFDDLMPVYIIDADGPTVRGSLRLLPTTGPTLSEETFSDTIPDAAALSTPTIWECSRLCVGDYPARTQVEIAANLLIAVGNLCLRHGIETIIANTHIKSCAFVKMKMLWGIMGLHDNDRGCLPSRSPTVAGAWVARDLPAPIRRFTSWFDSDGDVFTHVVLSG
jgi:N-acyl-L-homoserine lactone synthetase